MIIDLENTKEKQGPKAAIPQGRKEGASHFTYITVLGAEDNEMTCYIVLYLFCFTNENIIS